MNHSLFRSRKEPFIIALVNILSISPFPLPFFIILWLGAKKERNFPLERAMHYEKWKDLLVTFVQTRIILWDFSIIRINDISLTDRKTFIELRLKKLHFFSTDSCKGIINTIIWIRPAIKRHSIVVVFHLWCKI